MKIIYIIYNQVEKDIKSDYIDIDKLISIIYTRAYFIEKLKNLQFIQLSKIELDFITKYHIKEFNSRNNVNIKLPIKKLILSAQLLPKTTNELKEFAKKEYIRTYLL